MEEQARLLTKQIRSDEIDVLLFLGTKRRISLSSLEANAGTFIESWGEWSPDARSYKKRINSSISELEMLGIVHLQKGRIIVSDLGMHVFVILKDRVRASGK